MFAVKCDCCEEEIYGKPIKLDCCLEIKLCKKCSEIELVKESDDYYEMILLLKISKREAKKKYFKEKKNVNTK